MGPVISSRVILATLRELNAHVSVPLWLFGGVAVDFLAGRWTRPHSDVDLHAMADARGALADQLGRIGYHTADAGWLTHWRQERTGRVLEIVFLERDENGAPELHIPADAAIGIPGRYPLWPGYLDPARVATLDGVTFRVGSPAGEWLGRRKSVVAGRPREPKIDHDLALLESLIPSEELERLRAQAASGKSQNPR
jgi:hypothetical protein